MYTPAFIRSILEPFKVHRRLQIFLKISQHYLKLLSNQSVLSNKIGEIFSNFVCPSINMWNLNAGIVMLGIQTQKYNTQKYNTSINQFRSKLALIFFNCLVENLEHDNYQNFLIHFVFPRKFLLTRIFWCRILQFLSVFL